MRPNSRLLLREIRSVLATAAECTECPAGHFCFAGATSATACSKGTYAATTQSQLCTACPAGTYQNVEGSTDCVPCDPGYTCGAGSAQQVPTMCVAGTFFNATVDACVDCPAGSWCAGGPPDSQPRLCSRGMFANETGSESCSSCEAGTYMDVEGATACIVCDPGYTCAEGSVVQVPTTCTSGTFFNVSLGACVECPAGSWCAGGPPESQPLLAPSQLPHSQPPQYMHAPAGMSTVSMPTAVMQPSMPPMAQTGMPPPQMRGPAMMPAMMPTYLSAPMPPTSDPRTQSPGAPCFGPGRARGTRGLKS